MAERDVPVARLATVAGEGQGVLATRDTSEFFPILEPRNAGTTFSSSLLLSSLELSDTQVYGP